MALTIKRFLKRCTKNLKLQKQYCVIYQFAMGDLMSSMKLHSVIAATGGPTWCIPHIFMIQ